MQIERFKLDFSVSDVSVNLDAHLTSPLQDGDDWYCTLYIHGVVANQRFYGTSYAEAILNVVNFVTSILAPPLPILAKKIDLKEMEHLSVRYVSIDRV